MRSEDCLFIGFDYYSDNELALCVMRQECTNQETLTNLLSMFRGTEALELYKQLIGEKEYINLKDELYARENTIIELSEINGRLVRLVDKQERLINKLKNYILEEEK